MISTFNIKNLLEFKEIGVDGLAPVNIIIGPTDSRKTAILKLLYGVSKSLENFSQNRSAISQSFKKVLSEKLLNTFQPRKSGLGELVNRNQTEKLSVSITFKNQQNIQFSFGESTTNSIVDCTENAQINVNPDSYNSIFVPSKEVLTAFDAIALTRERFNMIGFDDTYYDLILDLRVPVQQGKFINELNKVNNEHEDRRNTSIVSSI